MPPLIPYLIVSVLHLVLLVTGPGWAVTATKALCLPLLALAVVVALRGLVGTRGVRGSATLLFAALGASWAGDVLLSFPGWFVAGLAAFLVAHLAFIGLFLRMPRRGRRFTPWTAAYAVWFAAFLALLLPHLGGLVAPVIAYGLVLGTMAALAGARGGLIAWGGALFVVSDSVLALGRFLPGYHGVVPGAVHDLVVMSTYLAAQALIAMGAVRVLRSQARRGAAPSSPEPDRRASATVR